MVTSVLTDTSACLPPGCDDVALVSIAVKVGEATTPDTAVDGDVVRDALRAGAPVRTCSPSVLDYVAALDATSGDAVVVLTPSRAVTPMWGNAQAAAALHRRPVQVVDTGSAAGGHGLVVEAAAHAASCGADVPAVRAAAQDAAARCELVAVLGAVALGQVEPIDDRATVDARRGDERLLFRFRDGDITGLDRADDEPASAVVTAAASAVASAPRAIVFHAWLPGPAAAVAEALEVATVVQVSPALAVHTGPDLLGVAWLHR